jgi:ubiquinone/menaquinone biosynthesis C-methylase UbiE
MNKEYYKEYYDLERNHWWFKVREKIIKEQLIRAIDPSQERIKILNIGAATGRSSQMLLEIGEVTSIEYDEACCHFTSNETNLEIQQGTILDLQFADQSFDLVCAFDVIEHVKDDVTAQKEMYRVCRTGGIICVTVPAYMSLWSKHDEINMHFRRYTLPQLLSLFYQPGQFIKKTYFNIILLPLIWLMRKINNLFYTKTTHNDAGSDFGLFKGKRLIDRCFYCVFNLERFFLPIFSFPAGVSILVLFKKNT